MFTYFLSALHNFHELLSIVRNTSQKNPLKTLCHHSFKSSIRAHLLTSLIYDLTYGRSKHRLLLMAVKTKWYVIVISVTLIHVSVPTTCHSVMHGTHVGREDGTLARDAYEGYSLYLRLLIECQRHAAATRAEQ